MSAANPIFRVSYVFIDGNNIARSEERVDYVQAASNDEPTIKTVLTNNGRTHGTHTIQIRSVSNAGGTQSNVLA